MINLHKDNSPRATYEASYLSWLHFVFINMLKNWIPNSKERENIREGFISLAVLICVWITILLLPISLPVLSLIGMINERRKFVRCWGKTVVETKLKEK